MKKVLIIGVSGQDGSYLSQHILSKKILGLRNSKKKTIKFK